MPNRLQFKGSAGLSSLGVPVVPGVPWHTQILADQLTLFQPGRTDYAHLITTGTPGFSDLPMVLKCDIDYVSRTKLYKRVFLSIRNYVHCICTKIEIKPYGLGSRI